MFLVVVFHSTNLFVYDVWTPSDEATMMVLVDQDFSDLVYSSWPVLTPYGS